MKRIFLGAFLVVVLGCSFAAYAVQREDGAQMPTNNKAAPNVGKQDSTKQDSTKQDSTKQDSTKQDSTKQDSTKQDSTKQDSTKQDSTKQDSTKQDSTKQDSTKQDSTKQDSTKQDSTKQDSTKQDSTTRVETNTAESNQTTTGANLNDRRYGPTWKKGSSWRVRATSLYGVDAQPERQEPVRWEFLVKGYAKLDASICYLVKVTCLETTDGRDPILYLWVDRVSGQLRRVVSFTYNGSDWVKRTQNFASASDDGSKAFATAATLLPIPISLPVFPPTNVVDNIVKGFGDDDSDATFGSGEYVVEGDEWGSNVEKAFGDEVRPRLTVSVRQKITPITLEGARELAGDELEKSFGETEAALQDAVKVEIEAGSERIESIWRPNTPWAIFSSNGSVEVTLEGGAQ